MLAETPIARPALRYRGGKWRMAPWIIAHFPPHECYVEPFMGAASVLLRKPRADFEAINDANGAIVNFFTVLRDRPRELQRAILLTPYARADYTLSRTPCPDDPLEWARRVWVQHSAGRGRADGANGGWRFQTAWNGWGADVVGQFRNVGHFTAIVDRLLGVQIECGEALDVIARYDRPGTLFYVDPPYLPATRPGSENLYKEELDEAGHVALLLALVPCAGMVVLSGYEHPLYAEALAGWRREERTHYAEAQKATTEVLWINPAATAALEGVGQGELFKSAGGE